MKPAQIVLLTGGSSGIGAAAARLMADAGTISKPNNKKDSIFAKAQEACRKDIERAGTFGCRGLQCRERHGRSSRRYIH